MLNATRLLNIAGFLLILVLVRSALVIQNIYHLEPCPLCILQRVCYFGIGLWFLIFALLPQRVLLCRIHGVLQALTAGAGLFFSSKQVLLQMAHEKVASSCGPGLEYMLHNMSLPSVVQSILTGTGDCSLVDWRFLGLSMAGWSALCFIFFLIWALIWIFKK